MFDTSNFSANEFIILSLEKWTAYTISRITSPRCRAFRVIPSPVFQFPYFSLVEKCLFDRVRRYGGRKSSLRFVESRKGKFRQVFNTLRFLFLTFPEWKSSLLWILFVNLIERRRFRFVIRIFLRKLKNWIEKFAKRLARSVSLDSWSKERRDRPIYHPDKEITMGPSSSTQ